MSETTSKNPTGGNEGKPRRKYTKRSAGERVKARFDATANVVHNLDDLSDEERNALAILERIKNRAAAKADAGEIKTATSSVHPELARLLDEQKRLQSENRKWETRERRLIAAELEAQAYRDNGDYRDIMLPWLETAIETVKTQIEAGNDPNPGTRPSVRFVDVGERLKELTGNESETVETMSD